MRQALEGIMYQLHVQQITSMLLYMLYMADAA
jgi:hypothetical protein